MTRIRIHVSACMDMWHQVVVVFLKINIAKTNTAITHNLIILVDANVAMAMSSLEINVSQKINTARIRTDTTHRVTSSTDVSAVMDML